MSWRRPRIVDSLPPTPLRPGEEPAGLLDEWAAMREVYEAMRHFDEPGQRRIIEAVQRRLGDEAAVRYHQADQEREESR